MSGAEWYLAACLACGWAGAAALVARDRARWDRWKVARAAIIAVMLPLAIATAGLLLAQLAGVASALLGLIVDLARWGARS